MSPVNTYRVFLEWISYVRAIPSSRACLMCAAYYGDIESTIKALYLAWYTHFAVQHAAIIPFLSVCRRRLLRKPFFELPHKCVLYVRSGARLLHLRVSAQNIKYDDVLRLHVRWSVTTIEDSQNGHIHYVWDAPHTHTHLRTTHKKWWPARRRHWLSIIIRCAMEVLKRFSFAAPPFFGYVYARLQRRLFSISCPNRNHIFPFSHYYEYKSHSPIACMLTKAPALLYTHGTSHQSKDVEIVINTIGIQ